MVKHLVYRTKWISIHKYKKGTVDCQLFNNGKTSFKICFKTEIFLERLYIHIYWKSKYSIKQFTIENLSSLYIYTLYFVQRIRQFFKIKKIRWLVGRKEFFIEEKHFSWTFFNDEKQLPRDSNASLSPSTLENLFRPVIWTRFAIVSCERATC